ncbi:hypothetical protein C0993_012469 [Termitomyces sp. T159_Od127]|nr:hypothetical protein C0993_012469 [Termitomyces sp. T159_Od127]
MHRQTAYSESKRGGSEQPSFARKERPYTAPNVLFFGETGVGKSSVINMLAGKEIAETSGDALGHTFENIGYNIRIPSISDTKSIEEIMVWDTAGLNEDENGTVPPEVAMDNLRQLVEKLGSGLNLLVYVVRGWRLGKVMKPNYEIFVTGICQNKVPVVLVITGCEDESPMENWWSQNKEVFDAHDLHFEDHACITSSRGKLKGGVHLLEEEYRESEEAVRRVVMDNLLATPWIEDNKRWMEVTKKWFRSRMFTTTASRQIAGPQDRAAGQKTNGKEDNREMSGSSRSKGVTVNLGYLGRFTWTPQAASNQIEEPSRTSRSIS